MIQVAIVITVWEISKWAIIKAWNYIVNK